MHHEDAWALVKTMSLSRKDMINSLLTFWKMIIQFTVSNRPYDTFCNSF